MIIRAAAILTLLATATPVTARAQSFAPSVKTGQNVWVTNAQGSEARGEVADISGAGIDISTAVGAKHFAQSDVWMIQKKDSNKQGFFIGAGVGLLAGSIGSAVVPRSQQAAYIAFGALMYGGLGALVDNMIEGRQLLYHRPERGSTAIVNISPIVGLDGPKRVGVGGTISWK